MENELCKLLHELHSLQTKGLSFLWTNFVAKQLSMTSNDKQHACWSTSIESVRKSGKMERLGYYRVKARQTKVCYTSFKFCRVSLWLCVWLPIRYASISGDEWSITRSWSQSSWKCCSREEVGKKVTCINRQGEWVWNKIRSLFPWNALHHNHEIKQT